MVVLKNCVAIFILLSIVYCLKVVPERVRVVFIDYEYFEYNRFYVSRHGRKSGYFLNMESHNYHPWYNNVTIHLIFNEYLHNEYRRTFVEMHFKLCDFLNEPFVGGMFKNIGVTCPVEAGSYRLMNMSLPTEHFPYVAPFDKIRVDVYINTTDDNIMMYKAEIYCHLKK